MGFATGGGGGQGGGMVKISGSYAGELRCEAVHTPSGMKLATDAPKDNQGKGEAFSPTDLCATALATCIVTTMGIQARTSGFELKGVRFEVTKIMSAEPPRRIAQLPVDLYFETEYDEGQRKRLERAAMTCPVHKSLSHDIEMPVTFHWADGETATLS